MKEEDKKGRLKRLKNEELLLKTTNKSENIKKITNSIEELLSPEAKALNREIIIIQKNVDYRKLKTIGSNNVAFDFTDFKTFNDLYKDLFFKKVLIDDTEMK